MTKRINTDRMNSGTGRCGATFWGGHVGWGEKEEEGGITIGGTWWILVYLLLCCNFLLRWQRWRGRIVYCYSVYFFVFVFNCFIGCVGGIFVAVELLDD